MPLYEYTCNSCGQQLEFLVRNGQEPQCSECGSSKLTKQFSVPAAHVSGSSLPMASMGPGGCGKPGCGPGGCANRG